MRATPPLKGLLQRVQKSFRDLETWQMAMNLAEATYRLTENFPRHELYGLTSQLRRAAVSIPSNIAEGSARSSRKEFRHFVLFAKGSACELQTQLLLAGRLGYVAEADLLPAEATAARIGRMLSGLARSLKPPTS